MLDFPKFKKINTAQELDIFATTYTHCSGFNVPRDYYASNQVFSVFWKGNMVGGFVLGTREKLRTLEVFAGFTNSSKKYEILNRTHCIGYRMLVMWHTQHPKNSTAAHRHLAINISHFHRKRQYVFDI